MTYSRIRLLGLRDRGRSKQVSRVGCCREVGTVHSSSPWYYAHTGTPRSHLVHSHKTWRGDCRNTYKQAIPMESIIVCQMSFSRTKNGLFLWIFQTLPQKWNYWASSAYQLENEIKHAPLIQSSQK